MKAKLRKTSQESKIVFMVLLCFAFIGLAFFYYQSKNNSVVEVIPSSSNSQTKNNPAKDVSPANSKNSEPQSNQKKQTAPTQSNVDVISPYGSFVSNHRPNLSSLSKMQSVCSTTPGAKCSITFKKNGQTKSLAEQTVGSDGSTTWDWDIVDAGLSVGTWEITATASSGGKTLSTKDTINLEVTE